MQSSGLKVVTNSIRKQYEEKSEEPLTAAEDVCNRLDNLLLDDCVHKPTVSMTKLASLLDDALVGIEEDEEEQEFNPYGARKGGMERLRLVDNILSPDEYSLKKGGKDVKTTGVLSEVLTEGDSPNKIISPSSNMN